MLACAIDREAAYLMGIDVRRMVRLSFIMSGALGALAGVLITPLTNATYDQGFTLALNVVPLNGRVVMWINEEKPAKKGS